MSSAYLLKSQSHSDIYVPKCWVELSFNSNAILDFSLFLDQNLEQFLAPFKAKYSIFLKNISPTFIDLEIFEKINTIV